MEPDLSYLPTSVQKLVALIGVPLTLRIVDQFGGTTLHLYRSEACVSKLADVVGREGAQKIIGFFGNTPLTVATCGKALTLLRNRDILAMFDRLTMTEGLSARSAVSRIVRDFRVHERSVWRILNTTGEPKLVDERQLSLI